MFCPSCGLEERQVNQFCRECGADLRPVRTALERPDSITASAVSARDEIGRAIAAKIRESQSAEELAVVADEVLPEIEKFLESPEEKRLHRIRNGTVVAFVGLGATIAFFIASLLMGDKDVFFFVGAGIVTFFIGLSLVLNGMLFTVPKRKLANNTPDAERQRELDSPKPQTSELVLPETNDIFSSVTEHTTHQLKEKQTIPRR